MPKPLPPQLLLQQCLEYDPDTGKLTWIRTTPQSRVRFGSPFGSKTAMTKGSKCYCIGNFHSSSYYAHRLIWMYMTGEDPGDLVVDHINGNGLDNRWKNLRLVKKNQHMVGQKKPKRRSSPYKHVYRRGHKWVGQVRRGGKLYSTTPFNTSAEAKEAVDALITRLDG